MDSGRNILNDMLYETVKGLYLHAVVEGRKRETEMARGREAGKGREGEGGRKGAREPGQGGRDFSIDDGDPCHPSLDIITAAGGLAMGHHDNDGHVWILRY